jgi:RNA polymerase sigma-70 factor (ECF subfamily)
MPSAVFSKPIAMTASTPISTMGSHIFDDPRKVPDNMNDQTTPSTATTAVGRSGDRIKNAGISTRAIDTDAQFKDDLVALIPYLRAFSRSITLNKSLAEDMAQTALVKAWSARSHFEMGTNLKAWLFTILRNETNSHFRRAWRQGHWDESAAENIRAPGDEQDWSANLSDVSRAMTRLPHVQREALTLVAAGGFTYAQAASICGVEVGTVKSRVARARVALMQMMESPEVRPFMRRPEKGNALKEIMAQIDEFSQVRFVPAAIQTVTFPTVMPAFLAANALPSISVPL